MADKPIKVAVLEGDFAALSLMGFPLGLAIQLQQSILNLADALWTAKSSNSGFSVSTFGLHKQQGPRPRERGREE